MRLKNTPYAKAIYLFVKVGMLAELQYGILREIL